LEVFAQLLFWNTIISNEKAEIYDKIMFLNSKLKDKAGGRCCLSRYEIIVGKLQKK